MSVYLDDGDIKLLHGDALEQLRMLPAETVQTCITSPPYWGLRDYGTDGQIGLEASPALYVDRLVTVLREVRRVLRDDGTLWLNLGDSYAGAGYGNHSINGQEWHDAAGLDKRSDRQQTLKKACARQGIKPKDLVGIPWRVVFALQQPYYAGTISDERDRIWLAAMVDAEGCLYLHRRREGMANGQGYTRKADSFGAGMEIANTSLAVIERCREITGRGSVVCQEKDRRQPLYRWTLRTNECRDVVREVYPYLVAKQHQARLLLGCPSSGERATAAWEALKLLHGGGSTTVDFAAPASMHEPGWYLRSDVVWSKLNPMPESVTDRPTRSHEYVFLLAKQPRYMYDADAIRESPSESTLARWNGLPSRVGAPGTAPDRNDHVASHRGESSCGVPAAGRNTRSVWTIAGDEAVRLRSDLSPADRAYVLGELHARGLLDDT